MKSCANTVLKQPQLVLRNSHCAGSWVTCLFHEATCRQTKGRSGNRVASQDRLVCAPARLSLRVAGPGANSQGVSLRLPLGGYKAAFLTETSFLPSRQEWEQMQNQLLMMMEHVVNLLQLLQYWDR